MSTSNSPFHSPSNPSTPYDPHSSRKHPSRTPDSFRLSTTSTSSHSPCAPALPTSLPPTTIQPLQPHVADRWFPGYFSSPTKFTPFSTPKEWIENEEQFWTAGRRRVVVGGWGWFQPKWEHPAFARVQRERGRQRFSSRDGISLLYNLLGVVILGGLWTLGYLRVLIKSTLWIHPSVQTVIMTTWSILVFLPVLNIGFLLFKLVPTSGESRRRSWSNSRLSRRHQV
ncbi:hypothetical protein BC829DRAFT_494551 [Chytridium lagenaria]|nr:hypothetical protein BC829DRAFT_494551 [Chytridium lagenaria]